MKQKLLKDENDLSEMTAKLRQSAEVIFQERATECPDAPGDISSEKTRRIFHELQVYQIELEMQNDELHRAHAELDVVKERYFDLYDLAPVGYVTVGENGLILEANLTASTLLGVARGALLKEPFSRFILKEDQDIYYLHRKRLFEASKPQMLELRMVKGHNSVFWARLETIIASHASYIEPVCRITLNDITVQKIAEAKLRKSAEELRTSLAEKELLLKEVHHRVKNNLSAIIGLVDLQRQTLGSELAKTAMLDLSVRIRSMALVHERLYKSQNFSRINFHDYLEDLIANLRLSYEQHEGVRVSVEAMDVEMGLDRAVPCGLFITELVTNAYRHAFPLSLARFRAGGNEIAVSAKWDGALYTLTVSDNGVGIPVDFNWETTNTLGLVLVNMLGQHQLQGTIELDRCNGTTFRLQFASDDTLNI
jgi:PAS domain S-box-containing protein